MEDQRMLLLYHEASYDSKVALIALHEKRIQFVTKKMETLEGTTLIVDGDPAYPLSDQKDILDHIFGPSPELFEEVESFLSPIEERINEVTFAICLNRTVLVPKIRHPFHEEKTRQQVLQSVMKSNALDFKLWLERYDEKSEKASEIVHDIASYLDQAELLLSAPNRLGMWLGGIAFSVADVRFSALLLTLYQLGFQHLWSDGARPHLSMYAHQAFHRTSLLLASEWKQNEGYFYVCEDENVAEIQHAQVALYSALGLAGLYIVKKIWK